MKNLTIALLIFQTMLITIVVGVFILHIWELKSEVVGIRESILRDNLAERKEDILYRQPLDEALKKKQDVIIPKKK